MSAQAEEAEPCFICEGQVVFSEEFDAFGTVKTLHQGMAWVEIPMLGGGYWTTEEFVRPAVWRRGRWT